MSRRYFGTDGVRGRVGQAPITPDFVMRLGYAAGRALVATEHLPAGEHPAVLIGKDTRVSGYMLEAALEAGFAAAGVDTVLAKVVPTPAVAYLTRALRLQAGVVISASHNPFEDNGIKFFSARGTKLPDEVELQIEALLDEPMGCMESSRLGKARRIEDAPGRYIEFCKSTFPTELDLRGLKIALDCAHGAAYSIAPKVFHELGAEVVTVGCSPNGMNINDGVGATVPKSLSEAVRSTGADIGIALDGDADRLMMCDASGRIYDGDELLYVIAAQRLREGRLNGVVGTLMTNLALEHALNEMGVGLARAKVGDRYVLEELARQRWLLGGEGSGHLLALDRHTTGDGLVSALQVLQACVRSERTLAELLADVPLFPQVLLNVRLAPSQDWKANPVLAQAIRDVEAELGDHGRVLVRASGTEPLLRVMVEARDGAQASRCAQRLADAAKAG
jgi:phosphoglucosamine mutase